MAKAIPQIFPRSLHKLCRWHIMRKHKDSLGKLYKLFPNLKDQLAAVLNHPLMPTEFEAAWHELVKKYNLHDVNVMRSESMNHVPKKGFVREQHDLHVFAQQVNNCIQTRHESEAAEATASMGVMKPLTRYGFEAQILEHYTRAVYGVFRERQFHSIGFRIKTSSQNTTEFLVHHYNQSREFSWSRHEFRVLADKAEGIFGCECKLWEHTGLFCLHVIAVFEHLRLDEIPRRYILKRYTKNAVADPVFNRRDYKMTAKDGTSLEYRRTMLFNEVVRIADNEQLLDIDEDEDYEDQTDDDENEDDVEDYDENEDDQGGEGEEEEQCQTKVTNEQTLEATENSKPTPAVPEGQRTCSICKKKASHNSRTCPDKDEILKKQLEEQQNSEDKDMVPQGKRSCSNCGKIRGHDARTCKKLQREEQLRVQMELESQKIAQERSPEEQVQPMRATRRSARLQ
ncbi:protein FAR1-RELATED SEQUENCE 5-like [Brachypodium distachyon]|uniref:protein FAR1-RELATED SEQUENCE 5-like n=1 Tax=Brachypodium distachyon TaxID=15368 RepID=UPI00053007CD|nr:protein FAR1-RELATED SEQUENCE 5-like [Brachypodium distachyon]|eukprot:XP_010230050.1 protein FAR1-RELATED SEQUENCE 5-like [Brachypodium distachyon]